MEFKYIKVTRGSGSELLPLNTLSVKYNVLVTFKNNQEKVLDFIVGLRTSPKFDIPNDYIVKLISERISSINKTGYLQATKQHIKKCELYIGDKETWIVQKGKGKKVKRG